MTFISMQIASQFLSDLVGKVVEIFGERDEHDVRVPQRRLYDGPVGHASVARNGVKVEVAVQVVFRPFDLFLSWGDCGHNYHSNL